MIQFICVLFCKKVKENKKLSLKLVSYISLIFLFIIRINPLNFVFFLFDLIIFKHSFVFYLHVSLNC
jgi:hypothetical protein